MVGDKEIKVYLFYKSKNKQHTASNNRFWSFYKMISSNYDCEILYINPLNNKLKNIKLFRGLYLRFQLINSSIKLLRKRSHNKVNVFYLFGVDPLMSLWYYFFNLLFGFILLSERNELPDSVINGNKAKEKILKIFVFPWYIKIFQGYSFITNEIYNYYKPFMSKKQVCTILPMTVDFSRFNQINENTKEKYIFYAGSLNNRKDGVDYLLKAFSRVNIQFPDIKLVIAGNSTKQDLQHIKKLIAQLQVGNISLLGQISREQIPQYVTNAMLCVLPRPDSPQARGGFPTKLGEYLASATPVITTNIGEIPDYLTKKEVYFISKEKIAEELPEKIVEVLLNYDKARVVGHNGYLKARKSFSLESNSVRLRNFINSIVN